MVGAKGAVGHEIISILEERKFPVSEFRPFGSARTKGEAIRFRGKDYSNRELKFEAKEFDGIDIVFSSPGASVSKKFVPYAIQSGAVVIDNTSAFRMDSDVPLVIPEINPEDLSKHNGIVANPNCSAIILLMAIAPLYRKNKIRRVICSTYQSASGAGRKAMTELETQARDFLEGKPVKKEVFPHQIAFNLFSHNSAVAENGYNEEELKVIQESRKILHDENIKIAITCVRVPVLRAHSQAIIVEFDKTMSPEEARNLLSKFPGVRIVDDPQKNYFPMPLEASGKDEVFIGRIRRDLSNDHALALFVSGDQLRKGAALNAVQIAEKLIQM